MVFPINLQYIAFGDTKKLSYFLRNYNLEFMTDFNGIVVFYGCTDIFI
jgi:hypothetical protein